MNVSKSSEPEGLNIICVANVSDQLYRAARGSPGICHFSFLSIFHGPPLWSSGQSFRLQIQRSRVRFPALPDFLSSSGSGTGSTQPREIN